VINATLNPNPGPSNVDLNPTSAPHDWQCRYECIRRRRILRGILRHRRNRIDLHLGKALSWLLAPARELASSYRQQPASHTVTARHIRYVCVCLKALRNDPRLLFRRPSSPTLPPRNHLDPLISATFSPGIIRVTGAVQFEPPTKRRWVQNTAY